MNMLSDLAKRCVDISYRKRLTHVSSVLNTVDLLGEIYAKKAERDIVVQGNGHAGLALYVVLESLGLCDAEEMLERHGIHPCRDVKHGVIVSSGSLGQAETIACGLALADKSRDVWLVSSDGGCMEGSVAETLRFARNHLANLKMTIVFNGFGAYGKIRKGDLPDDILTRFIPWDAYPEWMRGLSGHYLVLNEAQRDELMVVYGSD